MSRQPKKLKLISSLSPQPLMRFFDKNETNAEIAEILQLNRTTVSNYRNNKVLIRFEFADELACRLGLHPLNIWGDDWLKIAEPKPRTTKK